MAVRYELRDKMAEVSADEAKRSDVPVVEVITSDAFRTLTGIERDGVEALRSREASETSFVEVYPGFWVGSCAVPPTASTCSSRRCSWTTWPTWAAWRTPWRTPRRR